MNPKSFPVIRNFLYEEKKGCHQKRKSIYHTWFLDPEMRRKNERIREEKEENEKKMKVTYSANCRSTTKTNSNIRMLTILTIFLEKKSKTKRFLSELTNQRHKP